MIKVLHTLPDLHLGGVAKLLLKLFKNFDNEKIEHHLCYFGKNEILLTEFKRLGIKIHKLNYVNVFSLPQVLKDFSKLVKENEIDVIHTNLYLDRFISGIFSLNKKNIPIITSIHTTNSIQDNKTMKAKFRVLFEDLLAKHTSSVFIAVSNTVKYTAITSRMVPKLKIKTIHSGVEIPAFINRKINSEREIQIVSVGRLIYSKGFIDLLYIFKKAVTKFPNLRLTIIGDGPQKLELLELIEELNLNDKVHMEGYCSDVPHFLIGSDIFVSCSKEEGFGLSVVEAMAYSLPIVTFKIPIFEEISDEGKNFIIVEKENYEKFADKIIEISSQDKIYQSYSKSSYERASTKYNIAFNSQNYLDVYRNLSQ